jgi:hypothetical protein
VQTCADEKNNCCQAVAVTELFQYFYFDALNVTLFTPKKEKSDCSNQQAGVSIPSVRPTSPSIGVTSSRLGFARCTRYEVASENPRR